MGNVPPLRGWGGWLAGLLQIWHSYGVGARRAQITKLGITLFGQKGTHFPNDIRFSIE